MPGNRTLATAIAAVLLVVSGLAALLAPISAATASAHPLGNFTINHYDRIQVSDSDIEVYRVLDMAEIPAFQERQKIDANHDGSVDDTEAAAYADAKSADLRGNMHLRINGDEAALSEVSHELTFPQGQGGLVLLRLTATYRAALPADWRRTQPRVEFEDTNYADRLGWREIVVRNGAGAMINDASVGADDLSRELTAYPADALSSPLDERTASFSFAPGAGLTPLPTPDSAARATRNNPDSTLSRFSGLVAKDTLTPQVIAVALLAAMAFGALHALSPGHGKTVVAAYLVGSRGTAKHALLLGLVVTATHTSTVYLLGFVTLYLSEYIVPERLYPWLGVASGALIVAMGMSLFAGRLRSSGLAGQAWRWLRLHTRGSAVASSRSFTLATSETGALIMAPPTADRPAETVANAELVAHDHSPNSAGADHHHGSGAHSHGFGPAHSHAMPEPGEKLAVRQLIGLGIFGGILPCPSAIVVMLSAIALHRVGFGLVLIVAFSLGLAGVLTAIGLAMVYAPIIGRRVPVVARMAERAGRSERVSSFALRLFPVGAAAAVAAAGLVILLRATSQF